MSYLLQVALMQALALAAYYLLLRHEPLGQLKRAYLLLGLLLPFAIPYWTIYYVEVSPTVYRAVTDTVSPVTTTTAPTPGPNYLYLVYWTGLTLLVLRFCYSLYGITRQLRRGRGEDIAAGARWVAVPGLSAVHSFGPWVFFPAGSPPSAAIQAHELAHVRQFHSLDRLLVAILRVVWWFNPVLYLYERAIIQNHELIADRAALHQTRMPIVDYQRELLHALTPQPAPALSSGLSHSSTKHRFLMLRVPPPPTVRALTKGLLLTGCWIALLLTFGATAYGQSGSPATPAPAPPPPPPPATASAGLPGLPGWANPGKWEEMSQVERDRYALRVHLARTKQDISRDQLATWQDADVYGVWLDGKRVENTALRSLSPADVHRASVSRLHTNAAHYGQYDYHVEVTTRAAYNAHTEVLKAKLPPGC